MRTTVLLGSILAGMISVWASPAFAAPAACKVVQKAELPVTMEGGQPVVSVKFNGVEERLLLDSGAFWSSISYAKASELKLKLGPGFTTQGVAGDANVRSTIIDTFTLANAPIKNVDFAVTSGSGDLAGLLGQNVLSRFDIEYDFPHGFVRLFKPENCGKKAMAYWAAGKPFSTFDVSFDSQTDLETEIGVLVNGKHVKAILDSGSSVTLLTRETASAVGVSLTGPEVKPSGEISGVGAGITRGWVAPVSSFAIGDQEEVKNLKMFVVNMFERYPMILGADFLISHRVFISNSQHKGYVTYEGGPVFRSAAKSVVEDAGGALQVAPSPTAEAGPTDAEGLFRRASLRASQGKVELALGDVTQAIHLSPETARYLYLRAGIYIHTQQTTLAMADLDHAISLDPSFGDALLDRAVLKYKLKDKSGSLADANLASRVLAKQSDLRLDLGHVFSADGKPTQGVLEYNLWMAAHTDDARLYQALNGRCYARALANVDLDDALKDCNRALALNPKEPDILDSRGLVQIRRRAFKEAASDYSAALAAHAKSAWPLFGRSIALRALGQSAAAEADQAAAIGIDADIVEEAAEFGISG